MVKKGLMIVFDGLGDRPQLDGCTPLEAARTPNFDRLAGAGLCGMVDPLRPGIPVDTHTGFGLLAGLPPLSALELTRGPVEAAGVGLSVQQGEVAMRCNFATLERQEDRWSIIDRRAGRIQEGTRELAESLSELDLGDGVVARFRPATQHRAVLVLSGPDLSAEVRDTDPGSAARPAFVQPCRPHRPGDAPAERTSVAVNRFLDEARQRLEDHPVNLRRRERGELPASGVITRGAGRVPDINSIVNRLGLRAAVVAAERTVLGLAALFRFTSRTDPRFTALPGTNLEAKVEIALDALDDHDLVYLHVKAPDICSHDCDPQGKRDFLERADSAFAPLLEPGEIVVGISADHSTDSFRGDHCGDPVPTLLYAPRGRRDSVASFGESACLTGGLGRLTAHEYLLSLIDAMDALPMYRPSRRQSFGWP